MDQSLRKFTQTDKLTNLWESPEQIYNLYTTKISPMILKPLVSANEDQ